MGSTPSLVDRIDRLESIHAIEQLIAVYCLAVDDGDAARVSQLFTPDCHVETSHETLRGRDNLFQYYSQRMGALNVSYHSPHLNTVEFDNENTAAGVAMGHVEVVVNGDTYVSGLRYYDKYIRQDGTWLIKERRMRQLYAMPLAELPRGLARDLRKRWPDSAPQLGEWPSSR